MQERIFTLKKGTEVADRFDGVTVPFQVPASLDDIKKVCNGDEKVIVAVFNQAHALNVQKHVKSGAMEADATVESLRKDAADFKYGQVRVRSGAGGAARVKPATLDAALGDDFLSMLTPEQRKLYEAKKAALAPKAPAADSAKAAAKPAATPAKK